MQNLIGALTRSWAALWPCYNCLVDIVNFPEQQFQSIGASGICPHCEHKSYFKPVGGAYREQEGSYQRLCEAARCESCKKFVLVVGIRNLNLGGGTPFLLEAFYPLGKPNDNVDAAVPPAIANDFKEALRCRWIGANKATVTMCRRAIQASCLEKKADKSKKLVGQIDELAKNGIITEPLRQFAHAVRLEGNDGAHPDADGLENVTPEDADDIIAFTREYMHHVYVMPAKLAARTAASAAAAAKKP